MMLAMYVVDMETRCRDVKAPVCRRGVLQKPFAQSDAKHPSTQSVAPAHSHAFARLVAHLSASWRVPAGA
jgi:hypothetical protein